MASEFDESLQAFLYEEGLVLEIFPGVVDATRRRASIVPGFEARLIEVTEEGERLIIASADGHSLDEAINEVVETHGGEPGPVDLEPNRVWTTRYKNSLPDSAFLYVRKDCVEYKEAGRSHPLDCRDLPVKNRSGAYDYAHVKNAISRAIQLEGVPMSVQKKLQAKARAIFKREFGGAED